MTSQKRIEKGKRYSFWNDPAGPSFLVQIIVPPSELPTKHIVPPPDDVRFVEDPDGPWLYDPDKESTMRAVPLPIEEKEASHD